MIRRRSLFVLFLLALGPDPIGLGISRAVNRICVFVLFFVPLHCGRFVVLALLPARLALACSFSF
jgi:hypothetical protein